MYRVITTAELLRSGVSKREIARAVKCCLRRVARGRHVSMGVCSDEAHLVIWQAVQEKYAEALPEFGNSRDREERIKVLIRARAEKIAQAIMASELDERHETFSHLSAAVIHGLPVVDRPFERVEVYRATVPQKHRHLQVRHAKLPGRHVTVVGIYRVTTIERTLIDVALTHATTSAVAMLDHALHHGLTTVGELDSMVEDRREARGQARVRTALDLMDARRESPGESVVAVRFFEHGIDGFVPQVEFRDRFGEVRVRVDFCHEASKTIVEFDGLEKYLMDLARTRVAIEDEKVRDAWLAARGYRVIHLVWRDLYSARAFEEIKRIVAERMQAAHAGPRLRP